MKYTEQQKKEICNTIFKEIANGNSVREVLKRKDMPNRSTFHEWIIDNKDLSDQYARACEMRAEYVFDEILEISDHSDEDHTAFTGSNVVQRDRLKIDTRKWWLAKVMPKKYGDKLDVTSKGDKIGDKIVIQGRKYAEGIKDDSAD